MKFLAGDEIAAPASAVWAVLTDFDRFEREIRARGAKLRRKGGPGPLAWTGEFPFQGRARSFEAVLGRQIAPELLEFDLSGKSAEGSLRLELLPLAPDRCRLTVTGEVRARSLAARLFFQSLRLARGRLNRRYQARVSQFAALLAARATGPAD